MSKKFIEKNIKLSLEFDRFIAENPRAAHKLPRAACVIITVHGDENFNRSSRALGERTSERGGRCVEAHKSGSRWTLKPLTV